jgi:hypothetical protein
MHFLTIHNGILAIHNLDLQYITIRTVSSVSIVYFNNTTVTLSKYSTLEEANEEMESIWEALTNNQTHYRFKNTYLENRILSELAGE